MQSNGIFALFALAASAPLVSALGKAVVVNNCESDVSVWSVGSDISDPTRLAANGEGDPYEETFAHDAKTGGRTLKITHSEDGLYTGEAQLNFAYALDGELVWYDLSNVFGNAFEGHQLVVASADGNCGEIVWENGVAPEGSQVKDCTSEENVTLTLCA